MPEGHEPQPLRPPRPTYWPVVLAASICFALWGVLTSAAIGVVGVAGAALATVGWIRELGHVEGDE